MRTHTTQDHLSSLKNKFGDPIKGALMQSAKPYEAAPQLLYGDAIFHLSFKLIGRTDGRSAIAAAAYRAGVVLATQDGSKTWDYEPKSNIVFSEIIGPACAPAYLYIRNELWIEVCKAEKRKNSNEAREVEASIPYQIDLVTAQELCREFARELVQKHGVMVDFSIHKDNRVDWTGALKNKDGMHVHFLLTTRRVTPQGFGEKTRELDNKSSGFISHWRVRWQDLANKYLEQLGSPVRISCLSNKDRGKAQKASLALGPAQTALERRGVRTNVGSFNRSVKRQSDQSD